MSSGEYRLKLCPFCGGQAKTEETLEGKYWTGCQRCLFSSPPYATRIIAARKWNSRIETYKSRWISCEERLPQNDAPCFVVCRTWSMIENAWKEGTLMILRYLPKEHRWNISGMADVTHWMPMPELPEMEGGVKL